MVLPWLVCAAISYLLGSCNSAIIAVRLLRGEDIRKHGSKSAGLTNTLRCFGKVPALITLAGDLGKGVVAALLCIFLFRLTAGDGNFDEKTVGYTSCFFAVIGHIFPIYYGFKGGKGILVSCSVLLVIDPLSFCVMIPFFITVLIITKYVSVASVTSAALYPSATFALHYFALNIPLKDSLIHAALTLCTGAVLILKHKENIKRLKAGTEPKFKGNRKAL